MHPPQLPPQELEHDPEHPEQELVQVPRQSPVQAPRQEELLPVMLSAASLSTSAISSSSKAAGIGSPLVEGVTPSGVSPSTSTRPAWSLTFSSGFMVFFPCSARIPPPLTGVTVKSYAVPANPARLP